MRAVNSVNAGCVDVELTVDSDDVAVVGRHPGSEVGVVVDLKAIAQRSRHREVLVDADPGWLRLNPACERHLGAGLPADYRLVQRRGVSGRPAAATAGQ